MPVRSTLDLVDSLQQSKLLSGAQLKSLKQQLAQLRRELAPEVLANKLVDQKLLTPWQSAQLLKGQQNFLLQQYQLLNPIGRGGMGHVFRAKDTATKDIVAIKVMAKFLLDNETLVSRFRREIKASARLNSPHVVKAMNAGKVGHTDFLVMEYVNGDQVDHVAGKLGRLPTGLACEIIRQAAVGLQHAHECGMVHRDIKPANLMINWEADSHGTVKLMDMGLVRLTEETEEESVTRAGQVMGTPDYMSPEQGWDTSKVDIRSDVYSLGCACFRLLTGSIPFEGANPLQVLSQRLQRDAPSVLSVCDDIPTDVAAVVSRMTTRDPAARLQTPAEVAAALVPFCSPLTKDALRTAATSAGAGATVVGSQDSSAADTQNFDGTYHQFLHDMQDGGDVDLAAEGPTAIASTSATLPALQVAQTSFASQTRRGRRPGPKRGQLAGLVMLGIATIVLALVAAFLMNRL